MELVDPVGTTAVLDTVDVDGIAEWRSFWSELPVVHQVDLDVAHHLGVTIEVTPKLRVASTAFGHHYDQLLAGAMGGGVEMVPAPLGPLAPPDPRSRASTSSTCTGRSGWPSTTSRSTVDSSPSWRSARSRSCGRPTT